MSALSKENETVGRGSHTLREIRTQPESMEGVLQRVEREKRSLRELIRDVEEVVVVGCGSAFNVAHGIAPILQKATGRSVRPVHSSDLFLNPSMFLSPSRKTLCVVISRSGKTTESVLAMRAARKSGCRVLTVACFADSPMAREADVTLVLEEAVEQSVTTTRSFTSMILCGLRMAAEWSDNKALMRQSLSLPALARERMGKFEEMGRALAEEEAVKRYAFVGSGSYFGIAREAQLKIKEMVLLPSDSYVSLDFQHGPMSNVDAHMLVCILVSDNGKHFDATLARNMKTLEGTTLVLCDRDEGLFRESADFLVELDVNLRDGVRDVLYMPTLQFMSYYRSLATGNDPDRPKNLSYFVELSPDVQQGRR